MKLMFNDWSPPPRRLAYMNMAAQTNDKTFSTCPMVWKYPAATGWNREEDKIGAKYGFSAPVERTTAIRFGGFPPPHPCARRHQQDQALAEEQGGAFWDVEL
jgi:hypothetical protein